MTEVHSPWPIVDLMPAAGRRWLGPELETIDALRSALSPMDVEVDEGDADEHDPWCVLFRRGDDEALLHFARIGRDYVIGSARDCSVIARGSLDETTRRGCAFARRIARAAARRTAGSLHRLTPRPARKTASTSPTAF